MTLEQLVALAKQGREDVLPILERTLDARPGLWKFYGDMGRGARHAWLELIGGHDLFLRESAERHAANLMAELAGPESTPLERLSAERIVALNLQVCYYETLLAQKATTDSEKVTTYIYEKCGIAERRLQQALVNLARVRKLLPRVVKVDVLISGQIETTVKSEGHSDATPADDKLTRIQVPANRIKDLLAAAAN